MFDFFTQPDLEFGGVSYATGIFWLAMLAVGAYLLTRWRDSNPIRSQFGRQVGIVSVALGGLGLVLLILNFFQVTPFNNRLGMYLVGLISLGYLAYAVYVYNSKLPAQIAASRPTRNVRVASSRGGARTYSTPGATATTPRAPREPRPVATTTRRDARREKKRKGR